MPDPAALENDRWRVVVTPEKGAGILAAFVRHGEAWLPVMPDARDADCDLAWASFLMVPYSNRIAGGRFTFGGTEHVLANGENHSIHGDVRDRPWRTEERSATRLCCAFRPGDHENVNWPWPFEAEAEYTLAANLFSARLLLRNAGETPMPAGFGWHPYFSRHLTRPGEPVTLQARVFGVYPDAHDNRIPSGPSETPPEALDFSRTRPVPPDAPFDICCCGYDGKGRIRWPDAGVSLHFDCSSALDHLVLYNPVDKPYFAVEPVTNATDGVNLFARGDPTSGIAVLKPGETLEARFDLRVEIEHVL